MGIGLFGGATAAALSSIALLTGFQAARPPEADLAELVKTYLSLSLPTDWDGLEKLPNSKWASRPPTMLKNCLPNGDCFAWQGTVTLGGRSVALVATGARTMVFHLLFRNTAAPIGESAILAALQQAGLTAELVRCPIRSGAGGTNWYRLKGANLAPGHLSIQAVLGAKPSEGFILSQGEELPPLEPTQLALYSEQCAGGVERKPVSTSKPHEQLAQAIVALLVPTTGPAVYDWTALANLPTGLTWSPDGPKRADLSFKNDPNPLMLPGWVTFAGRKFSLMASGTSAQAKVIYLDEQGRHPRGEHMLGVVYEKGIAVRLVRCGPIYTESTTNWYSLTSAATRPAMIRQSIGYDGNRVGDSYELRLDGSLPPRDPRDRDPGVNGCQ